MKDTQIKAFLRDGSVGKWTVDKRSNLYFRVSAQGTGFFMFRYTSPLTKKRREITLGKYGSTADCMTLKKARDECAEMRSIVNKGLDPHIERKRLKEAHTVDDVALIWLENCRKNLKNPNIQESSYRRDIQPILGVFKVADVSPTDIKQVLNAVVDSGRPTVANDVLLYCKQIFKEAVKLGLISDNPASMFTQKDAGGAEGSRERALSFSELKKVFKVLRKHPQKFSRENYLAIAILVSLGVRKTELTASKWEEFDLKSGIWSLPAKRLKTKLPQDIPLSPFVVGWLQELKKRAGDSEYVFPARRESKRRGYISDDTINHALSKMFGRKVDSKKAPPENHLGSAGVEYFTVHDLRRTFRTLLGEKLGVDFIIAERCLNHKIKGVAGIYDRGSYFAERQAALFKMAKKIQKMVNKPRKS